MWKYLQKLSWSPSQQYEQKNPSTINRCHSVWLHARAHQVSSIGCVIMQQYELNTLVLRYVTLVPHVRITKLHCYCKHALCTLYRLGLGLRLGNIQPYMGLLLHDSLYEETTLCYMYRTLRYAALRYVCSVNPP